MTNILQIPMFLDTGEPLDSCVVLKEDARWKDCLEEFKTCRLFGFDIETFGLDKEDGLNPWKGSIRLVQVALPSKRVMIADFGGFNDDRAYRINEYAEFLSVLQTQLYSRDVYSVGHNLKFDCLFMLVQFGFETRSTRDTMLMSQVLWAGVKAYSHSLKSVAARLGLGEVDKTEQKSDWGWGITNSQLNYAAKDALIVLKMLFTLGKELEKAKLTGSAKAECEALPAFVQMDYVGFPVNESKLDAALSQWKEAETPLLKPFTDEFPEVNPNAPHAVVAALNAKYGLGVSSSDKDALTPFADKYPAVKHLLLWRSLTTSIDYLKGIKAEIRDGSVRGVYRQIAPRGFGRSTSGNKSAAAGMRGVNLQNPRNPAKMPLEIRALNLPEERSVFEAPKGYKLLVADLSSAHARIATEVSQDPTLLDAYNSGKDLHSITASALAKLQGLDWDWAYIAKNRKNKSHGDSRKCEELRVAAKPSFFGSLNAQGWKTLQDTARTEAGIEMSDELAQQAIQAWRTTYRTLFQFQRDHHRKCNRTHATFPGVKGIWAEVRGLSGRRCFMQKMTSTFDESRKPEIKLTDAVSFVWTSCEADVIKIAMAGCLLEADNHPEWELKLVNCCHDELDFTVREEYAVEAAKTVRLMMAGAMRLFIKSIPVEEEGAKAESMICSSWAEK